MKNFARKFTTTAKRQVYFPNLNHKSLETDFVKLNPNFRFTNWHNCIPVNILASMHNVHYHNNNLVEQAPFSVGTLRNIFEMNGLNYDQYVNSNKGLNKLSNFVSIIDHAFQAQDQNEDLDLLESKIWDDINSAVRNSKNQHFGLLINEMHSYNPYFNHEYKDVLKVQLDEIHPILVEMNLDQENPELHKSQFEIQSKFFKSIYTRQTEMHSLFKLKNTIHKDLQMRKEFQKDSIHISEVPNSLLQSCKMNKNFPLGEEFLNQMFEPSVAQLPNDLQVSQYWILNELLEFGIISDVLGSSGFPNLQHSAHLHFIVKFYKYQLDNEKYLDMYSWKPQVAVELLKMLKLPFDQRYEVGSKVKFEDISEVKKMFQYKDIEDIYQNEQYLK